MGEKLSAQWATVGFVKVQEFLKRGRGERISPRPATCLAIVNTMAQ